MAPPTLHQLLKAMLDKGASDLHITTGSAPQLRIDGDLVPLRTEAMTPVDTKQLCYSILTDAQKLRFEEDQELDLSFGVKNLARFRANIYMQRGAVAGAFRLVPFNIIPLEEIGLPPIVSELCERPRGLVLVCGPTGSGKSTTLASMLDRINQRHRAHIVTIEDPIEYLHPHKNSLVNQREIGSDSQSFKRALKYILRQDPDVVLIGEMRDLETIEAALTIAETGHLALATLHTNNAVQSINRIIDVFSPHQQAQIRAVLAFVLEGVICQTLIPRASGSGRVLACEVMVPNSAIRNLIREDKLHQIYSQMQIGQTKYGMQTMNQALADLVLRRLITIDEAMGRTGDAEELKTMIANAGGASAQQGGAAPKRRE
ncbi:MAG: type IV pilus twitching motility protein PilT [Deltaproteobacteria bacterium]|nr:type IV pilus twitching motility protein PilT [Deltaproteobacteria bacterium]